MSARYRPDLLLEDWGPAEQWDPFEGTPSAMHYVTAFLRSEASDRTWMVMRSTLESRGRKLTVLERSADGEYRGAPAHPTGYAGPLLSGRRNGTWGDWRADGRPLLTTSDDTLGWCEDGVLNLTGIQIGRPPRLVVRDAEFPFVYAMRWFTVKGELDGTAVTGTAILTGIHLPAGTQLLSSPYLGRLQIAWSEFCNEFEDGSVECGLLLRGRDDFAALLIQQADGSALATTDVSIAAIGDGNVPDFPSSITYNGAGTRWTARALSGGGRWPVRAELPDEHRLQEAIVRRVGEGRPVRRASGWLETYQARLRRTGSLGERA